MVNTNIIQQNSNILEVGDVNNTLKSTIDTYLENKKERSSINTYNNYVLWFKDFFRFIFGKEMEFCTWNDVSDKRYINIDSIEKYALYLRKEKRNGENSINNKISAIKKLFERFDAKDTVPINMKAFNIEKMKDENSEDNSYDPLEKEEVDMLYDYCKNQETNGLIKYLVFKTMFITGYRITAIRTLKWSQIKKKKDRDTKEDVWTIYVVDKGSRSFTTTISDDFYNELLQLKAKGQNSDSYVFSIVSSSAISKNTMNDTFNNFIKYYNLDKKTNKNPSGRNLAIHSVKHASVLYAYELSNHDLKVAQEQGKHKKVETTANVYLKQQKSLTSQISYIIDQDIDKTQLDNLAQEQLLSLIKSANDSIFLELVRQAKIKGLV